MAGVDRVSTIASEKTRAVKMSVDRDKVTLSVTSPENGLATEELPADYGSDGLEIGFNARYLMDILARDRRRHASRSTSPTPPRRRCCAKTTSPTRSTF